MSFRQLVVAACLLALTGAADPHSGGTNADGCHTNRRTGDYHCHRHKVPIAGRDTYCHVIEGQRRCGYALGSCEALVRDFGGYCRRE
jgi:hypothetical protein